MISSQNCEHEQGRKSELWQSVKTSAGRLKLWCGLSHLRRPEIEKQEQATFVLEVTWMEKSGRESDVAVLFAILTEQPRKDPGCAMYQVHRRKTEPRRF